MAYTIAEGKFPKKPEYGNYLEICRKDFRKFKDIEESKINEFLNEQFVLPTQVINDRKIHFAQKQSLEGIRKLIKVGKEDMAFSLFFQTYPTCLPHRSNR